MSPMIMDPAFGEVSPFAIQQHGHRDMVQASSFNKYGNRFALGSADGRIKVYDKHRDGSWVLCDTWGAHNAEILEVCKREEPYCYILTLTIPAGPLAAIYDSPKPRGLDSYRWQVQALGRRSHGSSSERPTFWLSLQQTCIRDEVSTARSIPLIFNQA